MQHELAVLIQVVTVLTFRPLESSVIIWLGIKEIAFILLYCRFVVSKGLNSEQKLIINTIRLYVTNE